jgi:hypothetical protein
VTPVDPDPHPRQDWIEEAAQVPYAMALSAAVNSSFFSTYSFVQVVIKESSSDFLACF